MRLELEIALARVAGRLSRLAGRGGGTTIPGKLLTAIDSEAMSQLARRLSHGCALVSATNGKTTTASMVAEILAPSLRLAHNHAGANLVSGVASALLAGRDAQLGLFEVDEAALPGVALRIQPRALCLGNLFRDQLDRYGELEQLAERWRRLVADLDEGVHVVVNGDDPQVGDLVRARNAGARTVFGVDDPSSGHANLDHAADSKYCVVCGTPYRYAVAYVGHLGDYECPSCGHARPALDVTARRIEGHGLDGVSFDLVVGTQTRRIRIALPGLYNVYNALAAASLAHVLGASLDEVASGLGRFAAAFGRFERLRAGERSVLMLLIKNPAGANEVIRTLLEGGPPRLALVALNDAIADGRDVSWIWDVDFEPLLARLERVIATGERAAELALRFKYGGFPEEAMEVVPDLEEALDRGLELASAREELTVLPTYTAMLALRSIAARRGYVRPYWEEAA